MGALSLLVLINLQPSACHKEIMKEREKKENKWDSRTDQCAWLPPERGLEQGKMEMTSDMNSSR